VRRSGWSESVSHDSGRSGSRTVRLADALAAFAAHADPSGAKVLVVVVHNAGWHRAKYLAVPPNVRLHFLPPCTPELQPVEPF
jgi:hypothetical protein